MSERLKPENNGEDESVRPLIMLDFLGAETTPTDAGFMRRYPSAATLVERLKFHTDIWTPDLMGDPFDKQLNAALMTNIWGYVLVNCDYETEPSNDNWSRKGTVENRCAVLTIHLPERQAFRYPLLESRQSIFLSEWRGDERSSEFAELLEWIKSLKPRENVVETTGGGDDVAELPPEPEVDVITGADVVAVGVDPADDDEGGGEDVGHAALLSRLSQATLDEIEARIADSDWSLSQSMTLIENAAPDKDVETLKRAAQQDHWPSVTLFGIAKLLGYGGKRDRKSALKHFERAAKVGSFPRAMREYGCLLDIAPRGVERDANESRLWLAQAAEAGIVKAKTDLARHLFGTDVGKDPEAGNVEPRAEREAKAVALLREAQTDDVQAKGLLGWAMFNGRGTRQSVDQGQSILHRAADEGDAVAAFVIADAYLRGQNANKEPQVAYRWFKKSAQRGHPHAPFYIGWMHWFGVGTEPSYREATQWMVRAAELGDQSAPLYIAEAKMKGLDGPVDMASAVSVLRAASETNPIAAAELGDAYLFGRGVPTNEQKALELYQGAALKPDTDVYAFRTDVHIKSDAPARALVGLGRILEAGRLGRRNRAGAVALFKAATTRTKDYRLLHDAYTQLYHLGERPQPS